MESIAKTQTAAPPAKPRWHDHAAARAAVVEMCLPFVAGARKDEKPAAVRRFLAARGNEKIAADVTPEMLLEWLKPETGEQREERERKARPLLDLETCEREGRLPAAAADSGYAGEDIGYSILDIGPSEAVTDPEMGEKQDGAESERKGLLMLARGMEVVLRRVLPDFRPVKWEYATLRTGYNEMLAPRGMFTLWTLPFVRKPSPPAGWGRAIRWSVTKTRTLALGETVEAVRTSGHASVHGETVIWLTSALIIRDAGGAVAAVIPEAGPNWWKVIPSRGRRVLRWVPKRILEMPRTEVAGVRVYALAAAILPEAISPEGATSAEVARREGFDKQLFHYHATRQLDAIRELLTGEDLGGVCADVRSEAVEVKAAVESAA